MVHLNSGVADRMSTAPWPKRQQRSTGGNLLEFTEQTEVENMELGYGMKGFCFLLSDLKMGDNVESTKIGNEMGYVYIS